MCGIAGRLARQQFDSHRIPAIAADLFHRGPDGFSSKSETLHDLSVDLFFSRLAIIDLNERSMQPFEFDESSLIFNGEIFNYLEVKNLLISLGHTFRTNGDAEVLIHCLRRWGISGLDRLEGMWAFAWHDRRDNALWLSRDRFGEKPLYWYQSDSEFVFGSVPKVIFTILGKKLAINENQLLRFIVNGYKSLFKSGETFFDNLHSVDPGTWIKVDSALHIVHGRYWNLEDSQDEGMSFDDAVQGSRILLDQALKLRLNADVPIAFCLSSGIDSNSLAFLAKKLELVDVHAYTVRTRDARYDESALVKLLLKDSGFKHTFVDIQKQRDLSSFREMIKTRQAPISTITYFMQSKMLEQMHNDGFKVSISGTAADELFAGYYDHHNLYLAAVAGNKLLFQSSIASWKQNVEKFVRNPYLKDPYLFLRDPNFRDHIYLNSREFEQMLCTPWSEPFTERKLSKDILRNRMLNELLAEVTPVILQEDDFNAMSVSIENRSPFLNRDLVEFAFRIPTRHLIRAGLSKVVLREAITGVVPETVRTSFQKIGFNASISDIIDLHSAEVRDEILSCDGIWSLVSRPDVEKLLQKSELSNSESKFLFNVLNCMLLLDESTKIWSTNE